jgi:hypothetical protein
VERTARSRTVDPPNELAVLCLRSIRFTVPDRRFEPSRQRLHG